MDKILNLTQVSVEPPPKQGCEEQWIQLLQENYPSQWNPRRSRGARWQLLSVRRPA